MKISIVVPFYNEEDGVEVVLIGIDACLKNSGLDYEIVAVDNGSSDTTGRILRRLRDGIKTIRLVEIPVNQGYGWGIISGLEQSSGDYVGFMCGDNQVEPGAIVEICEKIRRDNLDLCKVIRVQRQDNFMRKAISFFYNLACPGLFRIKAQDLNGTPKIFKRLLLKKLNLVSKGWFIDAEIVIKCRRMGCSMGEVPVIFKKREKGASKVDIGAVLDFLKDMLVYKYRDMKGEV